MSYCCVLMYHAIYNNKEEFTNLHDEEKPYAISSDTFREHLTILKKNNIKVLNFKQFCASISNKNTVNFEFDEPSALITFDDGHQSFHKYAKPILEEFGYGGLFFITPDYINTYENAASWDQIRELNQGQHTVGGHGFTHKFIGAMLPEDSKYELEQSNKTLTKNLQTEIKSMSFPGGSYNKDNLAQANKSGYDFIFGSHCRVISNYRTYTSYALPRVAIRASTSIEQFSQIITNHKRYYLKKSGGALAKKTLKLLIGQNKYHQLYCFIAERLSSIKK